MDAQLKKQLAQTVTVAAATGIGNAGDLTYGTSTTIAARVEFDSRIIQGSMGETKSTTHAIISETEIPLTSRVWLPGTTVTAAKARTPLAVEQLIDEKGSTYGWVTLL